MNKTQEGRLQRLQEAARAQTAKLEIADLGDGWIEVRWGDRPIMKPILREFWNML